VLEALDCVFAALLVVEVEVALATALVALALFVAPGVDALDACVAAVVAVVFGTLPAEVELDEVLAVEFVAEAPVELDASACGAAGAPVLAAQS